MNILRERTGSALFALVLLAGLLSIFTVGAPASAQTTGGDTAIATGATLTSGRVHTCAIVAGGGVECWGVNYDGQLGDGTTTKRSTAVAVVGLAGPATAVAAGDFHTCAVLVGGDVQCWGSNEAGQLGTAAPAATPTPVTTVADLDLPAVAVTAGQEHTCALVNDGTVRCWGSNFHGSLGNGTADASATPVTVIGLAGPVSAIGSADGFHTCAIIGDGIVGDGLVQCWGNNGNGQLGDGTTIDRYAPVTVTELDGAATDVSSGQRHSCAALADGGVRCWGENRSGRLGDGTETDSLTPVSVTDLKGDADTVAPGGAHTCAGLDNGTVRCSGSNRDGQLGNGASSTGTHTPVTVTDLGGNATAVVAGRYYTCAALDNGKVQCWGFNRHSQLGDGTAEDSSTPVTVKGLSGPIVQPGGPLDPVVPPPGGSLSGGSLSGESSHVFGSSFGS